MESELMPCPVCGGPVGIGWDTESQGQAVECSTDLNPWHYKVAGSDYADAVAQHNALARRAEIGALVERMCRNGSLDGPLKVFPSRLVDGPVRVSLVTCASGVSNGEASTLLDALRCLAASLRRSEVSGE